MKKIICLSLLACLFTFSDCLAFDWKALYEKADRQVLSESLKALQQDPGSIEDSYVLALSYFNLHKDKEAGELFRDILKKDSSLVEAKWGLAEALRRQHKLSEAQELLNEVIGEQSRFYPAYISLAYIKYIRMDFNQCALLASKVIRAGREKVDLSNYVRAYCLYAGAKGMIAHYGGPFSKLFNGTVVKSNLDIARKLEPDSVIVFFGLGSFYLLAPQIAGGDMRKAQAYLEKAIQADPLFSDAYVRLAQLYKARGDSAGFKKYLDKALELDPANELALDTLSGACKYICI